MLVYKTGEINLGGDPASAGYRRCGWQAKAISPGERWESTPLTSIAKLIAKLLDGERAKGSPIDKGTFSAQEKHRQLVRHEAYGDARAWRQKHRY